MAAHHNMRHYYFSQPSLLEIFIFSDSHFGNKYLRSVQSVFRQDVRKLSKTIQRIRIDLFILYKAMLLSHAMNKMWSQITLLGSMK